MKFMLLAAVAAVSPLPLHAENGDTAAIHTVIERFRTAIIAKDAAALNALPANDHITFISALDEPTFARVRHKRPDARRATASSYADFVREVTTASLPQEEVFSNIVVHSDGSVATVWFDYDFHENSVVTNSGHESWGLIHDEMGWKISSIVYSISLPTPPS